MTIMIVLLLTLVGLSFLLFGHEWLGARREEKFTRELDRYEGLIEALGFPGASLPPRIAEIIVMFGGGSAHPAKETG